MPKNFSIMTCNVHSCAGRDRKISPRRIADVIAHHESDIIALQEVDIGLLRTGMTDQAQLKFNIKKPVKPE
jgi:endonuclease/exonuclease/phosphatase family metal-dependent hydrolase